jgi:capsular polysaccharide biosynthesis protein/MinD-like ATPase involved in chromosome partitioning or flagellar assembly
MTLSPNASQPQSQSTARRQVDFLKRQAPLIVFVTWAALAAAAAVTFTQPNVYRASATIVVGQGGGLIPPQSGTNVQPLTQTMASLLKDYSVASKTIRGLHLNMTPEDLLRNLNVSTTPDNAVLHVSYDSKNPSEALRILNRVGVVFARSAKQIGRPTPTTPAAPTTTPGTPTADTGVTATFIRRSAHASATPVSPRPVKTLAFAGIIGLALGIVLALLRDALDERIHRRDELEENFGAPVIAALPKSALVRPVVDGRRGLDYGSLQAIDPLRLQLSRAKPRERLVTITSGGSGDGKSTVAASLGVALALSGADVICVDVAPNRHSLSYRLGLSNDGAAPQGSISGPGDLQDALRDVSIEELAVQSGVDGIQRRRGGDSEDAVHDLGSIVAGNGRRGRLQLLVLGEGALSDQTLASWSISDLIADLKALASYVIVDAPSLGSGTTFALLSVSDSAIVAAREGRTTKEQARFVRNALETLQMPRWGIVSIGRAGPSVGAFAQGQTRPTQARSRTRERKAR